MNPETLKDQPDPDRITGVHLLLMVQLRFPQVLYIESHIKMLSPHVFISHICLN